MKTLLSLTLLVLVVGSYAAPLSDLMDAEIESLLKAELQDYDARSKTDEIEDAKNDDYEVIAQGYDERKERESVENQDFLVMQEDDDDDDNDRAAELEDILERAGLQGWKKAKKFGSKAFKGVKKVASNPTVRGLAKNVAGKYLGGGSSQGGSELENLLAQMQEDDDDDDDIAKLEAMLDRARLQKWSSFTSKLKSLGSKVVSGVKKVASNPIVKSIAKKVIDKYSPIPLPTNEQEKLENLLAQMQEDDDDDDDDDIAKLEAMLDRARLQKWSSFTSKLKSLGSKVVSGVKNVASNPIVKSIAKKVIDKYSPIPLPTREQEKLENLLLAEALME